MSFAELSRAAVFYTGSQIGNAFGGLFAIGILKLDGKHGIAGWRWLFIVEGAITLGGEPQILTSLPLTT